jgi:hypothetical protein
MKQKAEQKKRMKGRIEGRKRKEGGRNGWIDLQSPIT